MELLIYTFVFIFGLIIGSFLNVVIYRYNTGRGIGGRSFCMSCNSTLLWYELIPFFSFIIQKGKCNNCSCRISYQYIAVEFLTAVVFVLTLWTLLPLQLLLGTFLSMIYLAVVMSILIVITVYDLKHKIIPDALVYTFSILAFIGIFGIWDLTFSLPSIEYLLAGPLLALPFAVLWFISRGAWIGLGDAKLVLGLGWFLGLSGGGAAIILAFWIGAVVGLSLIALGYITKLFLFSKTLTIKSEIPFGPFLVLGTFLVFLFNITTADVLYIFV